MHIHYNTNQTTLPLEISSFLPQDHLVFTIEKVVNTLLPRLLSCLWSPVLSP